MSSLRMKALFFPALLGLFLLVFEVGSSLWRTEDKRSVLFDFLRKQFNTEERTMVGRAVMNFVLGWSAPAESKPVSTDTENREGNKSKILWHQHIWLALPFALVVVGGAIGGACGGAAWAINQQVFRKTTHPVLRYVWTGLISLAAVIAWMILAAIVMSLFSKSG